MVVIPGDGTPHGFGNDPHSRWLRSAPPAQALEWVERSCGVRVLAARAFRGVMSCLPGRVDWSPDDLPRWLRELAGPLKTLHETQVEAHQRVPEFRPYEPGSWQAPAWLQDKQLWERALAVFHGPRLHPDRVFIHRDYHPGNVLWRRGRVSGLVDWQAACMGPRSVDVWHCRGNLLSRFGEEAADRCVAEWEAVSGRSYHPGPRRSCWWTPSAGSVTEVPESGARWKPCSRGGWRSSPADGSCAAVTAEG